MSKRRTKIDEWLDKETPHKRKALENASRYFGPKDSLTINILEAIYGQESSFGSNRRTRGIAGAAGDFQLERETAIRYGLIVSKQNDQRFDIDDASRAAARHLKALDNYFSEGANLGGNLHVVKILDATERLKFTIASYNAGEGRIARAQADAVVKNLDPKKWNDVSTCLKEAGATPTKILEIVGYVEQVLESSREFSEKSQADKSAKDRKPLKVRTLEAGARWITKDDRHIPIED
jgi:membrane-bound lytic murein transglycosylase MltF